MSIASNPYQTFVHLLDFFDLGNDKCINIWRYLIQCITSTLGHSITSKPPPACQSPPSFDRGEQTCRSLFCPATMPPLPPMPSALRIDCYLIAYKKGGSVGGGKQFSYDGSHFSRKISNTRGLLGRPPGPPDPPDLDPRPPTPDPPPRTTDP